jgi:hypothetical protein
MDYVGKENSEKREMMPSSFSSNSAMAHGGL